MLALVAYNGFVRSEKTLYVEFADMKAKGRTLSAEQCVDEVLAWRDQCDAMELLCNRSIGRMMEMCLAEGQHTDFCTEVRAKPTGRTSFGFEECKAWGAHADRKTKKICGTTYRAIAAFCRRQGREVAEAP